MKSGTSVFGIEMTGDLVFKSGVEAAMEPGTAPAGGES